LVRTFYDYYYVYIYTDTATTTAHELITFLSDDVWCVRHKIPKLYCNVNINHITLQRRAAACRKNTFFSTRKQEKKIVFLSKDVDGQKKLLSREFELVCSVYDQWKTTNRICSVAAILSSSPKSVFIFIYFFYFLLLPSYNLFY